MTYSYAYRSQNISFKPHKRTSSLKWMTTITETPNQLICREQNTVEYLAQGHTFIFYPKLREFCERGVREIVKARCYGYHQGNCFSDTTRQMHILTHNDQNNMNRMHELEAKFQHKRQKGGYVIVLLAKKLLSIILWVLEDVEYMRTGPSPNTNWAT